MMGHDSFESGFAEGSDLPDACDFFLREFFAEALPRPAPMDALERGMAPSEFRFVSEWIGKYDISRVYFSFMYSILDMCFSLGPTA